MPELPEVEGFRMYVEKTSIGKEITGVTETAPNMLVDLKPGELKRRLRGQQIKGTHRHGKFLFIKLSTGNLMLHFGLTGNLDFVAGEENPARFVLKLDFADDSSLFFTDTRKMGKIALVNDIDTFIANRGYGPDALKISENELLTRLAKKRVMIKTALIDQKIVAGVGNEYSDEILFQSRIHPASTAQALTPGQLKLIFKTMKTILIDSVEHRANREKLGHYFFLGNRKAGLKCPVCGGKTGVQTIGGRSSYFCSKCQKLRQ